MTLERVVFLAGGIGILDSGVGGLTVVKEVFRQLPLEEVIYIGDSARCPYGSRPTHEIHSFTLQMIDFLLQFEPKAIVIACNTATAVVLEEVKRKIPIPVIGVIEPGARAAIRETKSNRIGVIGTLGTIRSRMYEKVLRKTHPDLSITSLACPGLVPLVEDGHRKMEDAFQIVQRELEPLKNISLDTLILGCTHYPIIVDLIQKAVGDDVVLISSAEETASELSSILALNHQLVSEHSEPAHRFFTTGSPDAFRKIAEDWLKRNIDVSQVTLDHPISARLSS